MPFVHVDTILQRRFEKGKTENTEYCSVQAKELLAAVDSSTGEEDAQLKSCSSRIFQLDSDMYKVLMKVRTRQPHEQQIKLN